MLTTGAPTWPPCTWPACNVGLQLQITRSAQPSKLSRLRGGQLLRGRKLRLSAQDAEGTVVVPLPYSRRVFWSSWLVAITTGVAALHRCWICSCLCFLVLFGTVNYWRDPRNGWRRKCDFFLANFGIGYHLLLAAWLWCLAPLPQKAEIWAAPPRPLFPGGPSVAVSPLGFGLLWSLALVLYRRARACAKRAAYDQGTRWHVAFHVVGNLANILLYPALPAA
eukprot:s183_g6.t1